MRTKILLPKNLYLIKIIYQIRDSHKWLSLFWLLGTLIAPINSQAQSFSGTLEGKVVDLKGTPVEHVNVKAIDKSNPSSFWESTSDSLGNYEINIEKSGNPVEEDDRGLIPTDLKLYQNYPNPFNPLTNIRFYIPTHENVRIDIITTKGSHVKTLTEQQMPPGFNEITWDGRDKYGNMSASSVYLYSIQAGDFKDVKKMLLMHNAGHANRSGSSRSYSINKNQTFFVLENLDVQVYFSSNAVFPDSVENLLLQEGTNLLDREMNRKPVMKTSEDWFTYDNFFPNDSIEIDLGELIIDDDISRVAIRQKNIPGANSPQLAGTFEFKRKEGSDSLWTGAMVKSRIGEFNIGIGIYDDNHKGTSNGELDYLANFKTQTQGFEQVEFRIIDYRSHDLVTDTMYVILEGPNHRFLHQTNDGQGKVWALNSATEGGPYQVYVDDELEKYVHIPLIGDPQIDFEQFKKIGNWIRYYVGEVSLPTTSGPLLAEPMHEAMNWDATSLADFFTEIDFPAYAWLMSHWRLGLQIDPTYPTSPNRLDLYRYGEVETGVPEFDELEPYWHVNLAENQIISVGLSRQHAEANVDKFSNQTDNITAANTYVEWMGEFFRKSCPEFFLIDENDLRPDESGIHLKYDGIKNEAITRLLIDTPTNNIQTSDLTVGYWFFRNENYPPSETLKKKFLDAYWIGLPHSLGFRGTHLSNMPGMCYGGAYYDAERIFLKPSWDDNTSSLYYDPRDINILTYFFTVTDRSKNPLSHRFD